MINNFENHQLEIPIILFYICYGISIMIVCFLLKKIGIQMFHEHVVFVDLF